MKTVLALGDSLIAGNIGESFLERSRELQKFKLINHGQDGEPVKGILRNLKSYLKSHSTPDILLLDGGGNDLLIPYMTRHHPEKWGPFFRKLARHGSLPIEGVQEFRTSFEEILNLIREAGIKHLILMTIPNLTEDPDSSSERTAETLKSGDPEFAELGGGRIKYPTGRYGKGHRSGPASPAARIGLAFQFSIRYGCNSSKGSIRVQGAALYNRRGSLE